MSGPELLLVTPYSITASLLKVSFPQDLHQFMEHKFFSVLQHRVSTSRLNYRFNNLSVFHASVLLLIRKFGHDIVQVAVDQQPEWFCKLL